MKKVRVPLQAKSEADIPFYASTLASGADVRASNPEPIIIDPHTAALIPTGLYFEIPEGYEIQVRPRSGLAVKHGITVLNTPGTIDADYRGELKVILINHSNEPFVVERGNRIAQIILAEVTVAEFVLAEALSSSERGSGGFGHTGNN